jgi:hypothetical protein
MRMDFQLRFAADWLSDRGIKSNYTIFFFREHLGNVEIRRYSAVFGEMFGVCGCKFEVCGGG